jgi:hypothetical protein
MATTEELAQLEELMEMVGQAQRRETDLGTVQLSELSRRLREQVESAGDGTDLLWAAESLQQLTKLLELKMGRRLDDASDESLGATPAL